MIRLRQKDCVLSLVYMDVHIFRTEAGLLKLKFWSMNECRVRLLAEIYKSYIHHEEMK